MRLSRFLAWLRSALPWAVAVAAVLGVSGALYRHQAENTAQRVREREAGRMTLMAAIVDTELRPVVHDLRVLADDDGLKSYLASGDPAGLDRAARRAVFFSRLQPQYDQIRYFDENGKELIWVLRGGNRTPPAATIDAAGPIHLKEAAALQPGQILLSRFGFEFENGQLVQPLRRLLRFSAPIVDDRGRRRGVYVIDYLASDLVLRLQEVLAPYPARLRILNAQGDWIAAENPDWVGGSVLPSRTVYALPRTEPTLWAKVLAEPSGQAKVAGGLFSWIHVSTAKVGPGVVGQAPFFVLGSQISRRDWEDFFSRLGVGYIWLTSGLLILACSTVWFFRRSHLALVELREAKDQLETRVRERTAQLALSNERLSESEQEVRTLNAELERRVERRTAELQAALQELEAFSYSVSHDLRAPLRHIRGYVEMLAMEARGRLTERGEHYLKNVGAAAADMAELIDNLLEFSRMGRVELRMTKVDLGRLVSDVWRDLALAMKGRRITWKVAVLPPVVGDPAMLKQVLMNLLDNAVKYTRAREQPLIEVGVAGEEQHRTIFFVRDNGAGFEMKYADKLFGVFQRMHRADEFEGTGIGLANVRRVISRHGGRTWAESAVDRGTTIYFTLEQAPPDEPAEAPAEANEPIHDSQAVASH